MCENEQYEQILEAIAAPVWTFDTEGRFGYVNAAFERQTGYDADAARDEPLTLVTNADDAQAMLTALADLHTADAVTERVSIQLSTRDGTRPVECHLALLESRAVVLAHDVSEYRAREERLRKFASVVSHDLRNPLDVALGRVEVLPDIADIDAETATHLDEIYSSLKRMEHLVDEVLTLTRQKHDTVDIEPVDLAAIAVDAWQNVETEDAILTVSTEAEVYAHRGRLLRLFENLFRNAVEHGSTSPPSQAQEDAGRAYSSEPSVADAPEDAVEHGSTSPPSQAQEEREDPEVTVEVDTLESSGDTVGFYVADDGPGIDGSSRERLFEGGYSTAPGGTGLGLAIVREIARFHGWSVAVTDSATGGARLEVTGVTLST